MRRWLLVAVIAVQVIVYAVVTTWSAAYWARHGWAGFGWQAYGTSELPAELAAISTAELRDGAILAVIPGSPADRGGLLVGDVVTAIEGVPADQHAELRAATASRRTGDTIRVELTREDASLTFSLELANPFTNGFLTFGVITSFMCGLAYLLIAALVAWAQPGSAAARVFLALASSSAAVFFAWAAVEPVFPIDTRGGAALGTDPLSQLALAVVIVLSVVMVNLLLHFSLVFPARRPVLERWPEAAVWLHTIPVLPFAMLAIGVAVAAWNPGLTWRAILTAFAVSVGLGAVRAVWHHRLRVGGWRAILHAPWWSQGAVLAMAAAFGPQLRMLPDSSAFLLGAAAGVGLVLLYLIVASAWSILTCVALARSYREAGPEARRQLRWPLWGLVVPIVAALALVVVGLVAGWLSDSLPFDPFIVQWLLNSVSKFFYILIPVAFAFGILRYRVMDVDVVIRRTLVYGGLTAFVLVAYLALVGLLGVTVVPALGLRSQIAAVIATVAVAALCVPVRRRLQSLVDRRMFRRRLEHSELLERADVAIASSLDAGDFARIVADGLHDALQARSVAVWIAAPGSPSLRPAATVGWSDAARSAVSLPVDDDRLRTERPFTPVGATPADPLTTTDVRLVAPARLGDRTVGLVTVGTRPTAAAYDEDEVRLVRQVARRVAISAGQQAPRAAALESAEARRIQESLLPSALPAIRGLDIAARWLPAREVSGDAYDALEPAPGRLIALVADVAGKGASARSRPTTSSSTSSPG